MAVTFELIPEKVSFVGAVLGAAGLGSIFGSLIAWRRDFSRERRAIFAEDLSLLFAVAVTGLFPLAAFAQGVLF